MMMKVGLQRPMTNVSLSISCCNSSSNITKVKRNGKSGRTLCPSFVMLYLLENMGCFNTNKVCNDVGGLFKIRYLGVH